MPLVNLKPVNNTSCARSIEFISSFLYKVDLFCRLFESQIFGEEYLCVANHLLLTFMRPCAPGPIPQYSKPSHILTLCILSEF